MDQTQYPRGRRRYDNVIVLADPDDAWPQLFQREGRRIEVALGDRALRVEHVGSTSVPGLAAKPVIDVILMVTDPDDEAAYVPPLEASGYLLRIREPGWFRHRLLARSDPGVNLHVFAPGCAEADRMIRFRDHLRTDPADREMYERTKRSLAARRWAYVQDYADAKTEVIADVLGRAAR